MRRDLACIVCGKRFTTWHHAKKTCSNKCRQKKHRELSKMMASFEGTAKGRYTGDRQRNELDGLVAEQETRPADAVAGEVDHE